MNQHVPPNQPYSRGRTTRLPERMLGALALVATLACSRGATAPSSPDSGLPGVALGRQVVHGEAMLEITQWLAGRDFARENPAAGQMANFVYLVSDRQAGVGVLVDPAWDVAGLLALAEKAGVRVVGAVATHRHFDHVGGNAYGMEVEGVRALVEKTGVPVWAHELDAEAVERSSGLKPGTVRRMKDGETLRIGEGEASVLHVPGHTPGAMCLKVGAGLLTGDTLFVDECGRVDLPGSDPDAMFRSLRRLVELPGETVVYPGHHYGPTPTARLADQLRTNPCLQPKTLEEWRRSL